MEQHDADELHQLVEYILTAAPATDPVFAAYNLGRNVAYHDAGIHLSAEACGSSSEDAQGFLRTLGARLCDKAAEIIRPYLQSPDQDPPDLPSQGRQE
jgi:hypothetical protein